MRTGSASCRGNVAALVKPPSPARRELSTWTAGEVRDFLEAVADDRLMPAYRLLASTGMRRGEVLGLRWSDVDLAKGRLTVKRSLTVVDDTLMWSSPKTSRSRRSLSLDPETIAVLRAHRTRQAEEKLAAGPAWADDDLVFCNELGQPLHSDRFTRAFSAAVRRSSTRTIRLHDLRHFAATALAAGIPVRTVAGRLGHANPETAHTTCMRTSSKRPTNTQLRCSVRSSLVPERRPRSRRRIDGRNERFECPLRHHQAPTQTQVRQLVACHELVGMGARDAQATPCLLDRPHESLVVV